MDAIGGSEREDQFTSLYRAHYGQVLAYCRRRLPPDAAADAVAEAFVAAWRNLDRMPGEPLLWLYGIARGAVSNQRRRMERSSRLRARLGRIAADLREPDHSDRIGWEDPVLAALHRLSAVEREALCLCAWEGLDLSQAAVVAGCSTAALKVRLFRARRHMRQLLDAEEAGHAVRASAPARSTGGMREEAR